MNDTCHGTPPHLDCTWNTSIVMKSSRDGKVWSPMQNITRGHDFAVLFNRATHQLVLQYPSGPDKGSSMQMLSSSMRVGDLKPSTWGPPTRIHRLGACTGFNVGPGGGGVQLRHSSTHRGRMVFCGHGNTDKSNSHQRVTCTWLSDDNGSSWQLTSMLEGFNECNLVEKTDGEIVLDSRNQVGPTNPPSRSSCACRLAATSTDGGGSFGHPRMVTSLADSSCQGSMVADHRDTPIWYYTGPNVRHKGVPGVFPGTFSRRANMTLFISESQGDTWTALLQIDPAESEYSSVTVVPRLDNTSIGLGNENDMLAIAWERDTKFTGDPRKCSGICEIVLTLVRVSQLPMLISEHAQMAP